MRKRWSRKMVVGVICILALTLVTGGTAALAMTGTLSVDITYRNIQITLNGEQMAVPAENRPFC